MKFIYDGAIEEMGKGSFNWETADVRMVLIDTAQYTASTAHKYLSSVPAAARIGTPQSVPTRTVVGRQFQAGASVTFPAVARIDGNGEAEAILLYVHTGNDATSLLVEFNTESPDASLPVLPNGGPIQITIPNPVFTL